MSMSYGEIRDALQAAISAAMASEDDDGDCWCYVQDFDDSTVVYYLDSQTYQVSYSMDVHGNVTLGEAITVRPVTTYVPVNEALGVVGFESRALPQTPPNQRTVEVRREPLTYERDMPNRSFVRDLVLAQCRDDRAAQQRLDRHAVEMRIESERRQRQARSSLDGQGFEMRVNPNTTAGQGGNFDLPLWLNQYFATGPRAPRVLADLAPTFPLPSGVQSISVPRITAGNNTQPEQDLEADPSADVTDTGVTAVVTTIAGMGDVALQLLEQSPAGAHLDWAFFKDLTEDYDAQLEYELLFGIGTGQNIKGITVASASGNKISDGTTVTASSLWTDMAKAAAAIGDNRNLHPEVWFMRTGRWMWFGAQVDDDHRPFVGPGDCPNRNADKPVANPFGIPLRLNDAIPSTLNTNQDSVIACRPSDLILFEGTPKMSVALEVLSGTLQARLQLRNAAAALTGRYPSSIAWVTGAGMAYPSGY